MPPDPVSAPVEDTEPDNPLIAEAARLNADGDDKDILASIEALNAQEDAEPSTPAVEAPVAEVAPAEEPVAVKPPAPPLTPPVTSAVAPELQQYITKLEEQQRIAQQQNEARVLEDTITQYAQELEEKQGFTPEQARFVARREGTQLYQQYQAAQFRQGQINAALAIGKEIGVDPQTLMNLPSPEAMREAATRVTAQGKTETRLAALEKENAELKKARIPAQHMDNGQGAPVAVDNETANLDRYNRGDRSPAAVAAGKRAAGL